MTPKKTGCGCSNIPFSLIIAIVAGGYWWLINQGHIKDVSKFLPDRIKVTNPIVAPSPLAISVELPTPVVTPSQPAIAPKFPTPTPSIATKLPVPSTPWDKKIIRGIYLSRYQVTNNADEQTIRSRVRYYHDRGINTIIHGVWGNGCTMYKSAVMQQTLGYQSCPNQFQDRWLEWTIDEAHQQGMQVHAYFEKGIKIDKNSPIYELAIKKKWLVPGIDRSYTKIDHYALDVRVPEVATFFKQIVAEFVTKYPKIDAVQWDDYLGYSNELIGQFDVPGEPVRDRTADLTLFVQQTIGEMKRANPAVSFDICHHNPYWAKRYFAADWQKWKVDRVFIQAYNDANFRQELDYAGNYAGVSITDGQLSRLKELVSNPKIKSILIFPLAGKPEETASSLKEYYSK
jgi:uncharacterized lipoprotein YddW (UPF0748 family)